MSEPATTTTQETTTPATTTVTGPFDGYLQPDGRFKDNWADSLPAEIKDAGAAIKNFDNFPSLVKEFHRLSQAVSGAVKVPGEGADEATKKAWLEAVGAGEKPEDYGIKEDSQKAIAEWAAKNRVPKTAVPQLLEMQKAQAEAAAKAAKEAEAKEIQAAQAELVKMWGGVEQVKQKGAEALKLAKHFGVDLDSYADPALANVFYEFAQWCKEDDKMMTGKGIPNSLFTQVAPNPRAQAVDIIQNPNNPDHKRYMDGDSAVVKKVVELMQRA